MEESRADGSTGGGGLSLGFSGEFEGEGPSGGAAPSSSSIVEPPPPILSLTGLPLLTGTLAQCLGLYILELGRDVSGRPVWRHAAGRNRFLAFDAKNLCWRVQLEADLGKSSCLMYQATIELYPCGAGSWKRWDGIAFRDEPSVQCTEATLPPPPAVLSLTGDGLTGTNAQSCLGLYMLELGREVSGRPVWRHAAGRDRFLAFDAKHRRWRVQHEATLGTSSCRTCQATTELYPCSAGIWKLLDDGTFRDEPSLQCTELDAATSAHVAPIAEIELTSILRSVRSVRAQRVDAVLPKLKRLIEAVRSTSDGVDATGVITGVSPSKQVLSKCVEQMTVRKTLLQQTQAHVAAAASLPVTNTARDARLKTAVADRDKARRDYTAAIRSCLMDLLHGRTLDQFRDHAAAVTADAACYVSERKQAKKIAKHAGVDLGGMPHLKVWTAKRLPSWDDPFTVINQESCAALKTALNGVASYETAFGVQPVQSEETDAAASALQSTLQGGWLEPDSIADEALVEQRLRALAKCIVAERRHWYGLSPFPYVALLCAGAVAVEIRTVEAEVSRSTLELYEELNAELEKEEALLATKVDEFEAELLEASKRVEDASFNLEEEALRCKRARRQSGVFASALNTRLAFT